MGGITLLGGARKACRGPTRRETLKAGALSLLGGAFSEPAFAALEAAPNRYLHEPRIKSVVLLYLQGGPPTQDMFDLKPEAPGGVGGEFRPIATTVPGIEVGELLPLTAKWMHRTAVVRSVYQCRSGCLTFCGDRDGQCSKSELSRPQWARQTLPRLTVRGRRLRDCRQDRRT